MSRALVRNRSGENFFSANGIFLKQINRLMVIDEWLAIKMYQNTEKKRNRRRQAP
jgi:hypothetical protein